jgi:TP901 family phage tail tape measure protein
MITNEARAILTAEDRASAVLAMVARNFDRLNAAANRVEAVRGNARAMAVVEQNASAGSRAMSMAAVAATRLAGPLAGVAAGYGAMRFAGDANRAFAQSERAMTRIAITGEGTVEQQRRARAELHELAREVALPVMEVQKGLDALVSAGRNLPEAMGFLPSVARTAQASGAATEDIARSADAVGNAFRIAGPQMQQAFDIMAAGGKAGKFELKDMARYLPELAPAAAAMGLSGTEGLKQLVAMLQIVRNQTGSAEEASASLKNIFAKMESDKTAQNFKEVSNGAIDIEKEFARARAEGKNLITVFNELTNKALGGDMSKIPKLFQDMEFARGMRAISGQTGEMTALMGKLGNVSGTVEGDLKRVTAGHQARIDRMTASYQRLSETVGARLAPAFAAVADKATAAMDAMERALGPQKTEKDKAGEVGNDRMTRAERSVAQAEAAQKRQQMLDDPNSEIYNMRDGGFAAVRPRGQSGHVVSAGKTRLERARKAAEAAREGVDRQARHLQSERNLPEGYANRSAPIFRNVDASIERDRMLRTDAEIGKRDDLVARNGQPAMQEMFSAMMQYAQFERGQRLFGTEDQNMFSVVSPSAGASMKDAIRAAVESAADEQAKRTGRQVDEGEISRVTEQLVNAAKQIGEAVPLAGPKGRVDGLAEAVQQAFGGGLKAEVKPDQITAKADVQVQSEVNVRVEPTSELLHVVARASGLAGYAVSRALSGVSMPHKEGSGLSRTGRAE